MDSSPSAPQPQTRWRARAVILSAQILSVLGSTSLLISGCNAPPQPNPRPSYLPGDTGRREGYDRRERRRNDSSGNGSYDTSDDDNRADSYNDERRHRHHERESSSHDAGDSQSYNRRGYSRGTAVNTPGQFDFYLLNLSWAPEYCYSHPAAAECTAHSAFVLHGLWPQNNDGTYPENCADTPGPADPSRYTGLYPNPGLLEHEWRTHGTCTGLSPDAYLANAQHAVQQIRIPSALGYLKQATNMAPDQILTLFQQINPGLPAQSFALSCGNNSLTAVEVCLDKTLHPAACQGVRSCRASTVRVPAP